MPTWLVVGACVSTEFGDEGFVRFVGTTSFRDGIWVGVELVRPKGKNNGSVQGVKYFECAPEHGLFARPQKLKQRTADSSSSSSGACGGGSETARPRSGTLAAAAPLPTLRSHVTLRSAGQQIVAASGAVSMMQKLATSVRPAASSNPRPRPSPLALTTKLASNVRPATPSNTSPGAAHAPWRHTHAPYPRAMIA